MTPRKFASLVVAALALLCVGRASALTLEVSLDTSVLSGTPAQLAFDLIDGDAETTSSVGISALQVIGGSLGGTSTSGGATGNPITRRDTDRRRVLQRAAPGSGVGQRGSLPARLRAGKPAGSPARRVLAVLARSLVHFPGDHGAPGRRLAGRRSDRRRHRLGIRSLDAQRPRRGRGSDGGPGADAALASSCPLSSRC